MSRLPDDLLWRQLRGVPAFRALLRAVESRFYQDLELPRPVLDLGCGDGHFAQATFSTPPEVGLDPSWRSLSEAGARGIYRLPAQAAGDRLPFANGQFGAVISNSVLEHIPDVDAVLGEAARVLRPPNPGGQEGEQRPGTLVFTVPSEYFCRFLSIASLLRRTGLDEAAAAYEGWFNRISRHHHCDPPAVWHQRLAAAGLSTVRWQYYFSRHAHHRLEWGHFLGIPSLVSKLIFGRWIIAPWRSSLGWTERQLRPFYEEAPPNQGAYLLFVAQRLTPGEEAAPLPPPSPAIYPRSSPIAVRPAEMGPSREPAAALAAPEAAPLPPFAAARSDPSRSTFPPRVKSVLWLATALLLAVIGQISWNWRARPAEPGSGLTWYGLALVALAVFIWQSTPRRSPAAVRPTLKLESSLGWLRGNSVRVIVVLTGLTLSLFAQLTVGDEVRPPGSGAAALLLWIAGTAVVLLALWPGALDRLLHRNRQAASNSVRNLVPAWRSLGHREILTVAAIALLALLFRLIKVDEIPYVLTGDEASMGREALRVLSGELGNPFILGWFSHPTLYYYVLALPLKLLGQTTLALRLFSPFVGALSVVATYFFARRAWGRPVALASSILLAGYHFHIHYSRLAINNIWDPLFAALVLGLLWRGWETRDRRPYLLAGLILGVSQYFYTGARLLLVLVGVLLLYWLLTRRQQLWEQRANLAAALLVALAVGLPLALVSIQHPDDYMARMNQSGIIQSGWLEREMVTTGHSALALFGEQLWRSALAFNYTLDPTFWYRPEIPLLRFWPSIFFVLGIGIAVIGVKKTPNFILLLWIGATILFAGALLENPPSSQRYVIAAPAVCMLVALALNALARHLRRLLGGQKEVWLAGVLSLAVLFSFNDLRFYFYDYTPRSDLGGLNTEVAQRVSEYLVDLEPEWRVYFFGFPRMGIGREHGFPSIRFLAPEVDAYDVTEGMTDPSQLPDLRFPAVFIFLPERAYELNVVRDAFPGGTEKRFPGRFERILFVSLEVPR